MLLLALVSYIFLPLFEISLVGNFSGFKFTASMVTANLGINYTIYSLVPFLLLFAAIGFNSLKNRYWGVLVAILIFGVIYFFATLTRVFQGFSLMHDPNVAPDIEMGEGLPMIGVGIGFYISFVLTVMAFISALVSLMPFKFNKRLEESIDRRFESGKKHISKVGHGIQGEIHKIGKHNKPHNDAQAENEPVGQQALETTKPTEINREDESRFMPPQQQDNVPGQPVSSEPRQLTDEEKYSDYMPKN